MNGRDGPAGAAEPRGRHGAKVAVALALSGGGTRAAAFAYGALWGLSQLRARGGGPSLLDETEVVSSVSGGSFVAAYLKAYGVERLFNDFAPSFLFRDIECALIDALASPFQLIRLASPKFSRIDLAAELYEGLFGHKSFADLDQGPPYLVINATDMSSGGRFEFTQEYFDRLGSRLGPYSVARAVAASSAFPFLLAPITLRNFGRQSSRFDPAKLINRARNDWENNVEVHREALDVLSYLHDGRKKRYCHLLDGGLADNIGVRHIIRNLAPLHWLRERLLVPGLERLVIVCVNARTRPESTLVDSSWTPCFPSVLSATSSIAMDNYTDASLVSLERAIRAAGVPLEHDDPLPLRSGERRLQNRIRLDVGGGRIVTIYVVYLTFDGIESDNLRTELLNVGTRFYLPPATVTLVAREGETRLRRSAVLDAFARETGAEWGTQAMPLAGSLCAPCSRHAVLDRVFGTKRPTK